MGSEMCIRDRIIPARYLNTSNPEELAAHCMEDTDKDFTKISKGDIIVAGKNFGCGSSREHAPIAIKSAGISCVIAESFARIFYRNSINIGLPIFESKEAAQNIVEGNEIEVNAETGEIRNLTKSESYKAVPLPGFIQKIIDSERIGSTHNGIRKRLKIAGIRMRFHDVRKVHATFLTKYLRHPEIDFKIRKKTTRFESRLLEKAHRLIPVPKVLNSSDKDMLIVMEHIQGEKLKDIIDKADKNELIELFKIVGKQVALLHNSNIIHGDLTTSNLSLIHI